MKNMIWHIAKKEVHQNIRTLRFVLMIILIQLLLFANALFYGFGEKGLTEDLGEYTRKKLNRQSHIDRFAGEGLANLAMVGPGEIPKYPSRLRFCADGADEYMPRSITIADRTNYGRGGDETEAYRWREMWSFEYLPPNHGVDATISIRIDWIFIGIFLSFFAILFTYDAIVGERNNGTLSLMMSNQISRGQVLLAKFIGSFFTLMIPFTLGLLLNVLMLHLSGNFSINSDDWFRFFGTVLLFMLHISIFILLGLCFSTWVSNAVTSLVWLLLTWVCLAFVFPNLLAVFVGTLDPIPSAEIISSRKRAQLANIENEFQPMVTDGSGKLRFAPSIDNPLATREWAAYLTAIGNTKTRIADEHIDQQFRQVMLARELTQISPIACFQYAMEELANTGIISYMNFVKQVRRYRQIFLDYIIAEDRNDPDSLHIYFVREGISQKLVDPDTVPKFEESESVENIFSPILLLILYNLLFFITALLSFLKCDLK